MNRAKLKFTYTAIASLVLLFAILFLTVASAGTVCAGAAVTEYSNVLDDLQKDKNFKATQYPYKPFNYGLEVIQIAENAADELYVYVYSPAGETKRLAATSIKFSTTTGANVYFEYYTLSLLNSSGTLYKYKVDDFTVKKDAVRYYEISSIQRRWDSSVDPKPDAGNTISEKAFAVGQKWTVITLDGQVTYDMQPVEVVQVDMQTVGFRRYSNGINPLIISGSAVDAHFLAFSTKRNIDRLLSADLIFNAQTFMHKNGSETLGTKTRHAVTLHSDEFAENPGGGWLGKKAKWDRMASTSEFLNSGLSFKDKEIELFEKYDWVLNFYETPFDIKENAGFGDKLAWIISGDASYVFDMSGYKVSDVTLMRLEFESEGNVLNLGVVSDVQSGSGKPTNAKDPFNLSDVPAWAWVVVGVVVLIVAVIVLNILSLFIPILKPLVNFINGLITAPFRWVGNAIKRGRERREQKRAEKEAAERRKAKDAKKKKKAKGKK